MRNDAQLERMLQEAGERYAGLQQTEAPLSFSVAAGDETLETLRGPAPPPPPPPPAATRRQTRSRRLNQTATEEKARRMVAEASLHVPDPAAARDELIASLGQERIIGNKDFVDIAFIQLALAVSRGVGRIKLPGGAGTGFLIGERLLLTNHHVLPDAATASRSVLQMDYQEDSRGNLLPVQVYEFEPSYFFLNDKSFDFAICGVKPQSLNGKPLRDYPWLKLIGEPGKAQEGDPVNIIQHPRGELKQVCFRNNTILALPEQPAAKGFLFYTTDTEPGSSGSPCCNDQWELVALHHAGVPKMRNGKVLKTDDTPWIKDVDSPLLINWVANEGIRVSALIEFLRGATLSPEFGDRRDQILEADAPNPVELAMASSVPASTTTISVPSAATPAIPAAPVASSGASTTFVVPLQITISLGAVAGSAMTAPVAVSTLPAPAPPAPPAPSVEDVAEAIVIDPDFAARGGYDPNFLGVPLPLPGLSAAQLADTFVVRPADRKDGDKHLLAYHHFSLVMNKRRRTAWYSACIVDGDNRPKVTRGRDKWFSDRRVDRDAQLSEAAFADRNVDRGHITRREDANWGETLEQAVNANNDTFHFTNAAIQLSAFNQGKDRWQGLENFLLKHAKDGRRRMVITTGPLFRPSDPLYQNEKMKRENYAVRVPLQFWKLCALVRADESLAVTAFLLGQDEITELDGFEEKFEAALAQITVAELETLTGFDLQAYKPHDHFAQGGAPGTLEMASGARRLLTSFDDIVI